MFVMSHLATSTAKKVSIGQSFDYGDGAESLGTAFSCRFRDIATTNEASPGGALEKTADAMLWCDSETDIDENDVVEVDGDLRYRITRITRAKGPNSTVQFLKADLQRYRG